MHLKQVLYNSLLYCLDSCGGKSASYCCFPKLYSASFNSRQLIQHGNAGNAANNPTGRKGKVSNTLGLYKYAIIELGFRMVECDVRLTLDKVPVLCHDYDINNVATTSQGMKINHHVYVNQNTYSELLQYSFSGETISTLDELLNLCYRNNVICFLDVNCEITNENVRIIYDSVQKNNMLGSVFIETKNNEGIESFMALDSNKDLSYQIDKSFSINGINEIERKKYRDAAQHIIISHSLPKPSLRDRLKHLLIPCTPVNDYVDMEKIIAYGHSKGYIMKVTTINESYLANYFYKIGIDLICTDNLLFAR